MRHHHFDDHDHPFAGTYGRAMARFMRGRHALHGLHHGLHGRGRRFGGRVFDQGDLRLAILELISVKPAHGYELIKEIEERLGGAYSPSPGVIYPTLTLLEELGYIALTPADGAKKAYAITDEGRAHLDANRAQVETIFDRIEQISERAGSRRAPQIVRAMENLHLALRLKLERGRLSDDQVASVAAALDAAAREIEKD